MMQKGTDHLVAIHQHATQCPADITACSDNEYFFHFIGTAA